MNDLQRAAARARPALAVLAAERGEPSPEMAQALAIIEQMLGDIEAGRHPLDRPDDWPQRDRWPDRPHWDRWRWAIKTLAVASGTTAHCSQKYEYMRVDTRQARSDALTVALDDIGCLIELASDGDGRALTTVADLMDRLRAMPPELPVLVEGYETGWDAIHDIHTAAVRRNVDANDWDGEYEEQGKAEPKPGLPYQAVLIVGRRGHRRQAAMKRKQTVPPDQPQKAEDKHAESVRLSGDPLKSLAGIDEIINRGDHEAFVGLLNAIIEQPGGPVADRVRTLYECVQHRAADPEFAAWPQYQAAYWLTEALSQFQPGAMKQWSALRAQADEMAALLCVQPVPRAATADEVQQWIDWWQPSYEAAQRLSNNEIAACKANRKWPPVSDRMIAEMPPPIAQRLVPTDPAIMHAVYTLADYPVLAALAAERTQATRLDGRACRAIYEDARSRIDWQAMPPNEQDFAQRLGIAP